jgi:hypothetical protein
MDLSALEQLMLPPADRVTTLGVGRLMRLAYEGGNLAPLWNLLLARAEADPKDAAALLDLSTILLLTGQRQRGLALQADALARSALYRRPHGSGRGLRLLAFVAAGDFMANTPLDFLLEESDTDLTLLYVGAGAPVPASLPEHDLAFLAIAESAANAPVLASLRPLLPLWPRPVFNGTPERIAALSREGLRELFPDDGLVLVPPGGRVTRATLQALSAAGGDGAVLPAGIGFPLIIRPLDSHAGSGLARLAAVGDLALYLQRRPEAVFDVAAFIDYQGADGLYRKQRIAFVCGQPFAAHLAVSAQWMVHYLSAGMAESAAKREEEARFMDEFETGFARRHEAALAHIAAIIGLEYFAIDCAELADGRLLLFEADVAMILHALDSPALYPYKKPAMTRLFTAFEAALRAACGR